jgi:hypothetical protein
MQSYISMLIYSSESPEAEGLYTVYSVHIVEATARITLRLTRGGSVKEIELSRLSSAKPAKVTLTKVWFGLGRLSWTRSPRKAGVHSQLTHS